VRTSSIVALFVSLLAVTPAFGQNERVYVDVNFGIAQAAEDTYSTSSTARIFSETATFGADYFFPRGADLDFGGGYMITPVVGFGANFQGTAHQDVPLTSAGIPHPFFFNSFGSDVAIGDTMLTRAEGSFNLQVMVNATPNSERFRVRFFGGPSRFIVRQETIDDIRYAQVYQVFGRGNEIDITNYTFSEAEGSGWGIHGGASIDVFFSRVVGWAALPD
jgi:hypothetical protein